MNDKTLKRPMDVKKLMDAKGLMDTKRVVIRSMVVSGCNWM